MTKTTYDATLVQLLTGCCERLHDRNRWAVAADRAEECGYSNLRQLCQMFDRLTVANPNQVLMFTGSRCYGQPTPQSDVDLLISADSNLMEYLTHICDTITGNYGEEIPDVDSYPCSHVNCAMRFGPLNLIFVTEQIQWDVWFDATFMCCDQMLRRGRMNRTQVLKNFDKVWNTAIRQYPAGYQRMQRLLEPCAMKLILSDVGISQKEFDRMISAY